VPAFAAVIRNTACVPDPIDAIRADQGRLRVSAAEAATEILAASSGAMIQQPAEGRDFGLSLRMRESALASIAVPTEQG
jgi:hypothetical protein